MKYMKHKSDVVSAAAAADAVASLIAYVVDFASSLHDSSADPVVFCLMHTTCQIQIHVVAVAAGSNTPWKTLDLWICVADARNAVCVGGLLLPG